MASGKRRIHIWRRRQHLSHPMAWRCRRRHGEARTLLSARIPMAEGPETVLVRRSEGPVLEAYLLADAKRTPLKVDVHPRSLILHLPPSAPDPLDSVVVLELTGKQRWQSKNTK